MYRVFCVLFKCPFSFFLNLRVVRLFPCVAVPLSSIRRATRNFRGQGSRRQKGHNKKFCVKGISLRLCSLDLETEEIFEAFS